MTLALAEIPSRLKTEITEVRFTTESGSIYEIDSANKTWTRLNKTGASGGLRSEMGSYDSRTSVVVGKRFGMMCPPFRDDGPPRLIVTSLVVSLGGVQ